MRFFQDFRGWGSSCEVHFGISGDGGHLARFSSGFPGFFGRIVLLVGLCQRAERPRRVRAEAPCGGFARVVSPPLTSSQRVLSVDSYCDDFLWFSITSVDAFLQKDVVMLERWPTSLMLCSGREVVARYEET